MAYPPAMPRLGLLACLVLLLAQGAHGRHSSARPLDDAVDRILDRLEDRRDRSNARWFSDLARIGNDESFKGLKRSVTWMREERTISAAYAAFALYRGKGDLEEDAIAYLSKQALGNRPRESRAVAAATLGKFGPAGHEACEKVARKAKDKGVRWQALQPIMKRLGRQGDVKSLELLLKCARPALDDEVAATREALKRFKSPEARDLLVERLSDRRTETTLRMILLDLHEADASPEVSASLLRCLSIREPIVQRRAMEILSSREDVEELSVRLWSLLDSKDAQLRLVAIEGLGRIAADEERWRTRLRYLAGASDPIDRLGAARAMAALPTADAATGLYGLMEDDDWRVRLEVVQRLAIVRDGASVGILVGRMQVDTGRIRRAIAESLRVLTGEDHGNTAGRWVAWWKDNETGYVLPSLEDAQARLAELAEARAESRTVATFYGLPVYSDRVVFVFDTSGSMNAPSFSMNPRTAGPPTTGGSGGTAMEIARGELDQLLKRLPDGAKCNIIFFGDKLDTWKRRLTELDARSRKNVLKFIAEKEADGQTALYDALLEAFDDDEVDTIYLLSDGLPSVGDLIDPHEIRAAIAEMNAVRQIEIHGVDLSRSSLAGFLGRSVPLVRWLAEDSGGRFIAPGAEPEPRKDDEEEDEDDG